jgi:hypothetical protein
VLEVRAALVDRRRLGPGRAYRPLLGPAAVVQSAAHRESLNAAARAGITAAWVVGSADELAELADRPGLRPVLRLPVAAAAGPAPDGPAVLYEPRLGYLGAVRPQCRQFHLDRRVYARERSGVVALSPPGRRPTLLDIVPPAGDAVRLDRCPRHHTPVLVRRSG